MPSFSIICIFLSATLSVKGQTADGCTPLEQALRWERTVYGSDDPETVQAALLGKARCLYMASMPEDALKTLDRIRLYMLDEGTASEVLLLKSECCRATGDRAAELSYLEESGKASEYPERLAVLLAGARRYQEALELSLACVGDDADRQEAIRTLFKKAPGLKKEGTAAFLSFLPPLGQIYLGKPAEGLKSLALNAGAAGFTAWQLVGKNWVTGILGGGLLLSETFLKDNLDRNVSRVEAFNRESAEAFADSLESLLFITIFTETTDN